MPTIAALVKLLLLSVFSNRIRNTQSTVKILETPPTASENLAATYNSGGSTIQFDSACATGFSILQNGIERTTPSTVGCAFIMPGSRKENVTWEEESETYGWYRGQQHKFLRDVGASYKGKPTIVFFKSEDDATIPAEVQRNLSSHGFVYLTHSFSFEKSVVKTHGLIFQPDFHFIEHDGFSKIIRKLRHESKPYSSKLPIVFWRGSNTGSSQTCQDLNRVKICTLAKNFGWLDLKITQNLQLCSEEELRPILSNRSHELVWSNHKGILDIDGHVSAWGLFWRLGSGSVVFRVESPYLNAYILKMKPFIHYILQRMQGDAYSALAVFNSESTT